MNTEHDSKIIRCPKLGDEMTFSYCMQEAGNMPCARITACWQAVFDVAAFLQKHLTPEQWETFTTTPPKDKISSLIELIEKAKRQK